MKSKTIKIVAFILAITIIFSFSACSSDKNEDNNQIEKFKDGVWAITIDDELVGYYTFSENSTICDRFDVSGQMGIPFEYEIGESDYIFHLGSVDDETHAIVDFTDEDTATIVWEDDGKIERIIYVSDAELDDYLEAISSDNALIMEDDVAPDSEEVE